MKKTRISTKVLSIPDEIVFEIMKYTERVPLFNLILSNSEFFRIFQLFHPPELNTVRLAYLNRPLNREMKDDHFGRLISLFIQSQKFIPRDVKARDFKSFQTKFFEKSKSPINRIVIEEMFKFNSESGNSHFVVAGGFVLSVLRDVFPTFDNDGKNICERGIQDIDVFVMSYGKSPLEIQQCLGKVFIRAEERISKETDMKFILVKTPSSITIHSDDIEEENKKRIPRFSIPLQIILRQVDCVEELLCLFDLDCCRFAVDGESVFTTYEGRRSLQVKKNFNSPVDRYKILYMKRVSKYGSRGIGTLFKNVHPLSGYFSEDEMKRLLPEDEKKYYCLRHYEQARDMFDAGMYSPTFTVTYTEMKELHDLGVDRYAERYHNFFEDTLYGENNMEIEMRERVIHLNWVSAKREFATYDSFHNLLVTNDLFISKKYEEKHLYEKYDVIKCVDCGVYFKHHFPVQICDCISCAMGFKYDDVEWSQCIGLAEKIQEQRKVKSDMQFCSRCFVLFRSIVENENVKSCLLRGVFAKCLYFVVGGRASPGYEIVRYLIKRGCGRIMLSTRFPNYTFKKIMEDKMISESKRYYISISPLNLKKDEELKKFSKDVPKFVGDFCKKACFFYLAHSVPERRKSADMRKQYQQLANVEKRYSDVKNAEKPHMSEDFTSGQYEADVLSTMKFDDDKSEMNEKVPQSVLTESNFINNVVPEKIFRLILDVVKSTDLDQCFIVRLSSSRTKDTDEFVKKTSYLFKNCSIHHVSVNVEKWLTKPEWKEEFAYSADDQAKIILSKLFAAGLEVEN